VAVTLKAVTPGMDTMSEPTNFELVSGMNNAFGNPKGNPTDIDWGRVEKQTLNVIDELGEVFVALGVPKEAMVRAVQDFKDTVEFTHRDIKRVDVDGVRDGLTDIHVFTYGAHHLMGVNADLDMKSVIEGVMTRFIKDEVDRSETIEKHAKKGVTQVYFEGKFPTMVMKSAYDQPDAPKGKFLKSASYREPVFYTITHG
jgi:predicted HAD superfamily Cof-like phosphohydrolase